jgi:PAS domain-containing protein
MPPDASTLIPVPSDDLFFGSIANRAPVEAASTPGGLERTLRPAFPYVRVRIQHELARFGALPVWYVYRDGLYLLKRWPEWWRHDGLAHFLLDDAGRFVAADGPATRLFGIHRSNLIGMPGGDFFAPELRKSFGKVMSMLDNARTLETRWLVYRPDGGAKYAEFRFVRNRHAEGRYGAVVREVPADWLLVPERDDRTAGHH